MGLWCLILDQETIIFGAYFGFYCCRKKADSAPEWLRLFDHNIHELSLAVLQKKILFQSMQFSVIGTYISLSETVPIKPCIVYF